MDFILDRVEPEIIGFAVNDAGFDAAASHPHRVAMGVMIASTMAEVQSILDTFWDLGQEIVLQEFIRESKGRDIRAPDPEPFHARWRRRRG